MADTIRTPNEVKVFILYLLEKTGYPLGFSDLASIVIQDGFVDYFDFAVNFHELVGAGHVAILKDGGEDGGEKYTVSETGRKIARTLSRQTINSAALEKSIVSAVHHLSLEKKGATVSSDVEPVGDGTYRFRCRAADGEGVLFEINLRAYSLEQAEKMRQNFEERPDVIYRGLISVLTGDINYLIERKNY